MVVGKVLGELHWRDAPLCGICGRSVCVCVCVGGGVYV